MLARRHVVAFVSVYALAACSPDKAAAPTPACLTSSPLTLGILEGGVVGPPCAQLSSASGKYLAVAQYPV
ncbi:MAG TPA: hypothetical protein VNB89_09090, partial [Gemmatimonadaceae bacterium]|nr:hypothetical protein [Gemmatimonadaceae bacterium]